MKIKIIISTFFLLGNLFWYSTSYSNNEKASNDLLNYINRSNISLKKIFHHIQLNDFYYDNYKFHYMGQNIYAQNISSGKYPKYTPIENPIIETVLKVKEASSVKASSLVRLRWKLQDNPTPGMDADFLMDFLCEPLKDSTINLENNIGNTLLEDNILSTSLENKKFNNDWINKYISKTGYKDNCFNFDIFINWYQKKFLGFSKFNLGFDKQNNPVVFNIHYSETYQNYLNLIKGSFVNLFFTKPIYDNIEKDTEDALREVYNLVSKIDSKYIRSIKSVRVALEVKGDLLYIKGTDNLANYENIIYAVNKEEDIFVQGLNCGHHPDLLKGKYGLCAGHVGIEKGKIKFISCGSGHYLPSTYHLFKLVKSLNDRNLFSKDVIIEYYLNSIDIRTSLKDFLLLDEELLRISWVEEVKERIKRYNFFTKILWG
ncbi:MAG: hypothetical protein Q8K37_03260 [Alphaproteobacteria bacterium]|nr:hypothetical protein [Alphaproteobacteria bacterium]